MSILTSKELQAIRVRYQHMVEACPSDRGMLERDRYCRGYAQKDIPAMLAHIEAQRNALAKTEADKIVLVEALENVEKSLLHCDSMFSFIHHRGDTSVAESAMRVAIKSREVARAALASVKEESPCPPPYPYVSRGPQPCSTASNP